MSDRPLEIDEVVPLTSAGLVGIVLRNGSFADHFTGFLNSIGLQVAICTSLPVIEDLCPICIDGQQQIVFLDALEPPAASNKDNERKEVPDGLNILVDGKDGDQLSAGLSMGASGVGILRTEWMGWNNQEPPSEANLYESYSNVAELIHPHPVNFRLYDIGGDKIPYWAKAHRVSLASPLGLRGIRAYRLLADAFDSQYRAISKLSVDYQVGVVAPMVTHVAEVVALTSRFRAAGARIGHEGLSIGMMVEVPSAALQIDDFLPHVDFIRIGPGDLSQFTLGVLRQQIPPDIFSGTALPASVLRLIGEASRRASLAGKPCSVCLDMHPRSELLRLLLSEGISNIAVAPNAVAPLISTLHGLR